MTKEKDNFMLDFNALEVRDAGKCDCCHNESLLSYTIVECGNTHPNPEKQYCGYRCLVCGFGAAGDRYRIIKLES